MSSKAYAYSRYSSSAQGSGDSLKRQLKSATEFADKHGLELDTTLRDLGVSAFKGDHRIKGALGSFIKAVEEGEVERGSYLLVDSMDRLSRESETEVLHLLTGLTRQGIKVVNVSEEHVLDETAKMMDYMRVLIHASRSNLESEEKGRKVKSARVANKERARNNLQRWHKTGPAWLSGEAFGQREDRYVVFTPIPKAVEIVQRIFDEIEMGLGTMTIARRFNEEKISTFRFGTTWQHSAVLGIARSRAVIGEYQPKATPDGERGTRRPADGDAISGYYPEVIKPDQFYRVQGLIDDRAAKPRGATPNTKRFTNLFIGLGICNECGGTVGVHVQSRHQRGGGSSSLRCGNAPRNAPGPLRPDTACTNRTRISYPKLEAAILNNVGSWRIPTAKPVVNAASAELALVLAQRDDLAAKVEALLDLMEGGDARMRARYEQRVAELDAKEAEARRLKTMVEQGAVKTPTANRHKALIELLGKLEEADEKKLYDLRAAIALNLKAVVDQIRFHQSGEVDVIQAGGGRAYRFKDGEFVASVDLLPELETEENEIAMVLRAGLTSHDPKADERLKRVIAAE